MFSSLCSQNHVISIIRSSKFYHIIYVCVKFPPIFSPPTTNTAKRTLGGVSLYSILVSSEQISGIYFLLHIIQAAVIAVSNNCLAFSLEPLEVVYHSTAKEGAAILQRRFIYNNLRTLGLNALHYSLNTALAEVVGVGFHGQAVYADYRLFAFLLRIIFSICFIATGNFQHTLSDEVFTRSVAFNNRFDDVFRYVCIVRQQLLGVLRQAVTAITLL